MVLLAAPPLATAADGGDLDPRKELERRLAEIPRDDHEGRIALAAWAEGQDLGDAAAALYGDVLRRDPEHQAAYRDLVALAADRPLPRESTALESARRLLPASFLAYESRRFVALSDAGPAWIQRQFERLERAHHQFLRAARRLGLRPHPLRHKLVCVLFRDREHYADFGRTHDGMVDGWIVGYYSPRHDRIVFYDAESSDRDEYADRRAIATTLHEAIHQLLFHTRVQTVYVQYPLWICEGLATTFETAAPGAAFGPEHEFEPRRQRFENLVERGKLMPLRTLVSLDALVDADPDTIAAVYNQSYALVSWLARHRRRGLRAYLMLMLREPAGRPGPARHLAAFETAFGDVDRLERAWLRDEAGPLARSEEP